MNQIPPLTTGVLTTEAEYQAVHPVLSAIASAEQSLGNLQPEERRKQAAHAAMRGILVQVMRELIRSHSLTPDVYDRSVVDLFALWSAACGSILPTVPSKTEVDMESIHREMWTANFRQHADRFLHRCEEVDRRV